MVEFGFKMLVSDATTELSLCYTIVMNLHVAKRINIYSRQEAESKLAGLFRRRWADLYLDPLYQDTITGDPDRLGQG